MKTLHTAAPWFVIDDTNVHPRTKEQIGGYTISTHPNHVKERVQIAQLPSYGGEHFTDKETAEANARLISASPELLEACTKALPYIQGLEYENFEDRNAGIFYDQELAASLAKLKIAIAKATGEKEQS